MRYMLSLFFLFSFSSLFWSCANDVQSKPHYVFKSPPRAGVVAKVNDQEISHEELIKGIENKLYGLEMDIYNIKMKRFYALLMEKLMKDDPRSQGIERDEFFNKYINKGRQIAKKDIESFIKKLIKEKRILSEHVNDSMKERVKQHLDVEMKKKAIDRWVTEKTKKNPAEIYFPKPSVPILTVDVGDAPFDGKKDAKVTLVEFSDFECRHCASAVKTLEQIKKQFGKKIKVVFKNFPLPYHKKAKDAALAGLCANEQGNSQFWKLHDLMFADQKNLDEKSIIKSGEKVGLDLAKFKSCMNSKKYMARVDKDIIQGRELGVSKTPTLFVNGKIVDDLSVDNISKMIDQELK